MSAGDRFVAQYHSFFSMGILKVTQLVVSKVRNKEMFSQIFL